MLACIGPLLNRLGELAAKPLDARSDVFSFGAVLSGLLAGTRAFTGDSTAQILSAVLRDDPSPGASSGRDFSGNLRIRSHV